MRAGVRAAFRRSFSAAACDMANRAACVCPATRWSRAFAKTTMLQASRGTALHRALRTTAQRLGGTTCLRGVHTPPAVGQPLPHTHPHLFPIDFARGWQAELGGGVATDHLTPGIPAAEYEQRRRNLMDRLPTGSVVVLMGGRIKYMSRNILYVHSTDRVATSSARNPTFGT